MDRVDRTHIGSSGFFFYISNPLTRKKDFFAKTRGNSFRTPMIFFQLRTFKIVKVIEISIFWVFFTRQG
jgi:hypothetical protein